MMKRLIIFIGLCCGLVSCNTKKIASEEPAFATKSIVNLERSMLEIAFPDSEKELITLPSGITVEKMDSLYILGGDMLLSQSQIDILSQYQTRSAIQSNWINYWHYGKIYYEFAPNFISVGNVQAAMREWESKTCIRFFPKTSTTRDYIVFANGEGNSSALGKKGGAQYIYLAPYMSDTGTAIHEIGHAVGLFHEHDRRDRDQYITICWDNIIPDLKYCFDLYPLGAGYDVGTFDFESIMLYDSWAFVKKELDHNIYFSMVRKDGSAFPSQREHLSTGDIEGVKFIYGPPFVRVKMELFQINTEIHAGPYQEWDYIYSNTAEFFSDREFTNKVTTTAPRLLWVYLSVTGNQSYETVSAEIVPAGMSSYSLRSSWCYGRDDYGVGEYYNEAVSVHNP